ncbi:MAG: diacylglycerol kinase [Rhodobacteraceae bacterium]|nr:diacylglycerol kinase [Paracoccaceae bacterium]MCY4195700.1 diacylglycerol kinase [Paracoccaceae bacterium]MCY4326541.1 diacylglycerol kinase [Paracoccaceae bacterium]
MTRNPSLDSTFGIRRLTHALSCSAAGLRRLWKEPAFRLELALAVAVLSIHFLFNNPALFVVVAILLSIFTLAAETFNTAIEVIVDQVSPDWSPLAKQAKDLGSLGVFFLLLCNGIWLIYAFFVALDGTASAMP